MNAGGDFGELSDFTISSVNEGDLSDHDSQGSDHSLTQKIAKDSRLYDSRVLKIELSQKELELEKCKKEFFDKEEEMQERIEALIYQREEVQRRLELEVKQNQELSIKRAQQIQEQLSRAMRQQSYLETTNSKLIQGTIDLKEVLSQNLIISPQEYNELRLRPEYELSVRELIQIKMHETTQPLSKEIIQLKYENTQLKSENDENTNELIDLRTSLDQDRDLYKKLQEEFKKAILELSSTKDKVQIGNYKIENFDRIQKSNDDLSEKLSSIKSEFDRLKVQYASVDHERDGLLKNLADTNQSYRLMVLDKEYLTKQVNELSCRCNNAEERLQTSWKQLEETKTSREQLYDKYVTSRDEFRTQYESKLREELDSLRLQTEHQMEKIKISSRELYDRELKNLTDQKDLSINERDISVRNLREVEEKLEKTKLEYSLYQSSAENKISELFNEIKMKSFESERTNILYDEGCNKLKIASLDCEKLQAKFDMITKEYYQLECNTSKRISELEMQLENASKKLHSYERLEEELDLAVMHAAENEEGRPVLMWPHGYDAGNQLPTQSGRRMQQSIELARKILHLERMLRERNHTLEVKSKELEDVRQALERSEAILREAKQPYTYLIDALKKRDAEISALKLIQKDLTNQLNKVRKEKSEICDEKNRMTTDFEKLLSQKNELMKLKRLFEDMRDQQYKLGEITLPKTNKPQRDEPKKCDISFPKPVSQEYAVSRY